MDGHSINYGQLNLEHHPYHLTHVQGSQPIRTSSLSSVSSHSSDEGISSTSLHSNHLHSNYGSCKEEPIFDNEINVLTSHDDTEHHRTIHNTMPQAIINHQARSGHETYPQFEIASPIVLSQTHLSTSGAASQIHSPPTGSILPHSYSTSLSNETPTSKSISSFNSLTLNDSVPMEVATELTSHWQQFQS